MTRIIAVANQNGGVGKTTTCVNLAASLAATQRRVLLVDMDPQGNATMGCGVDKNALEQSNYDVLMGDVGLADVSIWVEHSSFTLAPSNADLTVRRWRCSRSSDASSVFVTRWTRCATTTTTWSSTVPRRSACSPSTRWSRPTR